MTSHNRRNSSDVQSAGYPKQKHAICPLDTRIPCAWSQTDNSEHRSSESNVDTEKQVADSKKGLFPERNERYEQYRLCLDQYRAASGVAEFLLDGDFDVICQDGKCEIHPPAEYVDTTFLEHFERALDEYTALKQQVEGENGEPGSLSDYRKQWPSPRKEDGVMVQEDVAEQIGINYGQDDPIFFPRDNGELYELPLPDGGVLTVDGIHERRNDDTNENASETNPNVVHLSATLITIAKSQIESDNPNKALQEQIDVWCRDLIAEVIHGNVPAFTSSVEISNETVAIELPEETLEYIHIGCKNESSPFDDPDTFVETAVRLALDIEPTAKESITIDLPMELVYAAQANEVDLESVIENALRAALNE
jgi:hypothetical protein